MFLFSEACGVSGLACRDAFQGQVMMLIVQIEYAAMVRAAHFNDTYEL